MTYVLLRGTETVGTLECVDGEVEWVNAPLSGVTGKVLPLALDEEVQAGQVVELVFHREFRSLILVTHAADTADRCARIIGKLTDSAVISRPAHS